jgi:hypothetical protein
MGLTASSQVDTSKLVKCLPVATVRQIIKDLLSGDSAKLQLQLTESQLIETEKKLHLKDSIINSMKDKEKNYLTIQEYNKEQLILLNNYSTKVENDLKKEGRKNNVRSVIQSTLLLSLTFLLTKK